MTTPLTGSHLLAFIKEQDPDCGKMEIARLTGYFKTKADGTVVSNVPHLMNAIAEANGIHIEGKRGAHGFRKRSYVTTCHATGIIMVGKTYTSEAGIDKGDKFEIVVHPGRIELVRVANAALAECNLPSSGGLELEVEEEEEDENDEEFSAVRYGSDVLQTV